MFWRAFVAANPEYAGREAHETFFRREGEALGYAFTPTMGVECERFRLVWPEPP